MFQIAISNETALAIDGSRIQMAVRTVLENEDISAAKISVAIVSDSTIHRLNRDYLQHDWPTDVLSFLLDQTQRTLEGEVIASAETAAANARRYGWKPDDELLLYVVHGALHLVGYKDVDADDRTEMRDRERHYLAELGLFPRYASPKARSTKRRSPVKRRLRHTSQEQ